MGYIEAGGTYVFINGKATDVALDLSGGDQRSIIGFQPHRGANQQWNFEPAGEHKYYLRNVGQGKYLSVDGEPSNGVRIIASEHRVAWEIKPDQHNEGLFRLFVPGTHFCADLSDHGNSTPGTPIQVWGKWNALNQCWSIQRV